MNKYLQKFIKSKASKRIVSGITAVVMMIGALPVNDLSEEIGKINFSLLSASAADDDTPPEDYKFKHDDYNNVTVKNTDFAEYSQYCQIYKGYHQNDKILISFDTGSVASGVNFAGLGSSEYPFGGSLSFEPNSDITLNLDAPLFNYVYDTVTIENNGNPLKLSRCYYRGTDVSKTTPLIASNVLSGSGTKSTWNINVLRPTVGSEQGVDGGNYLAGFGGLIGTMQDDASLTINVTMNADGDDTNAIDFGGSADIGLLCGCMEENSTLTAQFITNRGADDHGIGSITTSSGNAGGLVGTMKSGSSLIYTGAQYQAAVLDIKTSGGYAGGIVGNNEGGTITINLPSGTTTYTIAQHIEGTLGSGSIYGFYKPAAPVSPATENILDLTEYSITSDCQVNGTGNIGGLIGALENNYDMTIKGAATESTPTTSFTANHTLGTAVLGGVIGKYSTNALSNTFIIKDISVATANTSGTSEYGGGIGVIDDGTTSAYVKFDNFVLSSASNANVADRVFGGLVAKADKSFAEGNNVTIIAGDFRGGAAVGSLSDGVLKLSGTFNIEGSTPQVGDYNNGKIVGYRDNALIYADEWTYTGNNADVDNIGSWGDIIVMDGTNVVKSSVLTENTDHTVTLVNAPSTISNASTYALDSLYYSIDSGSNPVLTNSGSALAGITTEQTLTFSGKIDLTDTGLRGITRDNTPEDTLASLRNNKATFTGTVNGGNATIIQDFENIGGYPVYRHRYNGLFGMTYNATVSNLTFGSESVSTEKGKMALTSNTKMFGGALAGEADGTLTVSGMTVNTSITAAGGSEIYIGGLVGWATSSIGNIESSGGRYNCSITDNNSKAESCFGGIIGRIAQSSNNNVEWSFTNDTVTGSITSTSGNPSRIGGLIASIDDSKGTSNRALNLTNVSVSGMNVSGVGSTMGGLFGYSWLNVNTTFDGVTASGTVSNSSASDLAGLVYIGTGHWVVEETSTKPGININGLTVTAPQAKSFGMIVNQGKSGNDSAILLEIKNDSYLISSFTDELKSDCVYDELVAYSASSGKVNENGQGVVSINVGGSGGGLTMNGSSASNTYVGQTTRGQSTPNSNTRYYYNLDSIRENPSAEPQKLLIWSLNLYAHSSIRKFFNVPSGFEANRNNDGVLTSSLIPNCNYDMLGYSWYPVDVSGSVNVKGTFKFYNGEFEGSEAAKNNTVLTSLGASGTYTQHHLMQNGLFRDVFGTVNLGTITLQGNIGADDYGSGALVRGTVNGTSSSDKAAVIMSEGGKIILDGVFVHDVEDYGPLVIDTVSSYSDIVLDDVSNTPAYKNGITGISKDGDYPKAATSLIGKVGKADATNINLSFSKIKLDGRKTSQADSYNLNDVYNTSCSLFKNATLLQFFQYGSGASGIYNYEYTDDWGSTPVSRNVTYGSEISDNDSEYYGQEFWYNKEPHDGSGRYTIYKSNLTPASGDGTDYLLDFSGFLPYVATQAEATQHPLSVNHAAGTLTGCGTYNDPYQIPNAAVLNSLIDLMRGTNSSEFNINLPKLKTGETLQNKKWDTDGHLSFTAGSNYTATDGNKTVTHAAKTVREYVSGAYFKITESFVLPSDYSGLGNTPSNQESVFRGVIIGENNTITLTGNKPFIYASYGSVVKDLNIVVANDVTMTNCNTGLTFNYNLNGDKTYGAVMGMVLGGDNIIDHVAVNFGSSKIKVRTSGNDNGNKLMPIGGYVGVAEKGSLIFRNMNKVPAADRQGLKANTVVDYKMTASVVDDKLVSSENIEWLYVNPIVGRVVNCAVVTESDAYRPFEDGTRDYYDENGDLKTYTWSYGAVTMRNGTKNYSIADISGSLSEFTTDFPVVTRPMDGNAYSHVHVATLSFPNAQSLFIASLVTQAGISTGTYDYRDGQRKYKGGFYEIDKWGVQAYYGYRCTHNATYVDVGKANASTAEPTSGDYITAKNDIPMSLIAPSLIWENGDTPANNRELTQRESIIPYIVKKYTPKITGEADPIKNPRGNYGYIALAMTHQYTYLRLKFIGDDETFYMPDGFRGLGMIAYKDTGKDENKHDYFDDVYQDAILHIFEVNGNNKTISLNMNLLNYKDTDSYLAGSDKNLMGFGFFNSMMMNKKSASDDIDTTIEDYQIHDFTLTGNIRYDLVDLGTGNIPAYAPDDYDTTYLSVGGLTGTTSWRQGTDIYKTYISNVTPSNLTVSGVRYTGGLIGFNKSADDPDSKTTIQNISPKKLLVKTGLYGGGLIGYSTNTALEIKNVTISDPDIISTYTGSKGNNAVGGIVGYVATGAKNYGVELNNITVGNKNASESADIGYDTDKINSNEVVCVGGIIGLNYTSSSNRISDNSIKYSTQIEKCNIYNVSLYGHRVGGIIGECRNNNSNTIVALFDTHLISSLDSEIRGVEQSDHNDKGCAGFFGYFRTSKDNNVVDGCSIEGYHLYSALKAGAVSGSTQGGAINLRNLYLNDVTIHSTKTVGGLYGWNKTSIIGYNILMNDVVLKKYDSDDVPTDDCGYLCGNFNDTGKRVKIAGFSQKGTINRTRMLGNKSNDYDYGHADSYVIFADYEGKSLTSSKSEDFSNIYNYTNNVTDYNGLKVGSDGARDNAPYVSSSPKMLIGTNQYLTGDGVSSAFYNSSTFKKIVDDRSSATAVPKAYKSGPATALTSAELSAIQEIYSNSLAEFDVSTDVNKQFPLLIISDTDHTKITPIINNYLRTLTNTTYDFADTSKSAIYSVALNTCIYNKGTGEFELQRTGSDPDNSANLYTTNINGKYYFKMNANSVDNGHENAQFTLLDVQFKDPADTSKIAYHLYVPVLVKKLLQFEFNASIESGTPYYPNAYTIKRTLFENLGNPVTVKFEYTYQRTPSEWADAINQGENMLGNLYKSLNIKYSGSPGVNGWPSGTRLVLVDANNKDKNYYLDNPKNVENLSLSSFVDDSGTAYEPVPLNDLMTLTISANNSGKLVRNDVEGTNTAVDATVKDSNGVYYRLATADDGSVQKYEASVTNVNAERYYLSIFTPKAESDKNIYHIEMKSANKFSEVENQIGWRPNEVRGSNLPVHLLTGKLYETTYTLSDASSNGKTKMSSQNNYLSVTMDAVVSLTANAVSAGIPGNMQSAGTSTIYQTFMMTYDTKKASGESSVIGLNERAYPYVTMLSYKIYRGKQIDDAKILKDVYGSNSGYDADISGTNYIELWNRENLIRELAKEENQYAVKIHTVFNVTYDSDSLGYQFPKKTSAQQSLDIGAKVIGYSNISSNLTNITYSETSWRDMGQNRYYTEDDNSAVLTYNARTVPESADNIAGPYSSLGINALEVGNGTRHIDSAVVYDTSALKASGDYVEFTLKLSNRMDNYTAPLVINDYFKNLQIKGANDEVLLELDDGTLTPTDPSQIKVTSNATQTEYKVRVHKSKLPTLGQEGLYTADISYDVYTGDNKFNKDDFAYSNYMVTVSGALYDTISSTSYIPSSDDSDHIIYTNAKLQSQVIE